jgi:nitric oxide reductase NorD protein
MLEWLELEEQVGRAWHRLVGERASYPRHPEAAIELNTVRAALGVFFHGIGGAAAIQLAGANAVASTHRLRLLQRIGMSEERMESARLDDATLMLPNRIDLFPENSANRACYFWLAAFLAKSAELGPVECSDDPLARDAAFLRRAAAATGAALADFPGLAASWRSLCAKLKQVRPARRLTATEAAIEELVLSLLDGPAPGSPLARRLLTGDVPAAPRGYKPFLPVPLWGEVVERNPVTRDDDGDEDMEEAAPAADGGDERKRTAERRDLDQADRDDPLILNRFEKMLSLAEMVNVNRGKEDEDEEDAKKAAQEMDVITLSKVKRKAATRLRLDLDLPPEAVDESGRSGKYVYPEWDCRKGLYHRDHCVVQTGPALEEGEDWQPDAETVRRINRVRRQFEALRPKSQWQTRQSDGDELDIEAVVRSRCDLAASGIGSDRVYARLKKEARDLSVALLVDVSLSTDSWVQNRRVLDISKEALSVFVNGVEACGDEQGIFTFTSRKRDWVRVQTVKDFDESLSGTVMRRIGALRPGYYTRMGAAIRHVAKLLGERPHRHRLLLVLTDGKPNDVDHYEGRYGIEDSRKAVLEARRQGLTLYGLTIDGKAQDYFPAIFGRGAFSIVDHPAKLSAALPRIYRQVSGG